MWWWVVRGAPGAAGGAHPIRSGQRVRCVALGVVRPGRRGPDLLLAVFTETRRRCDGSVEGNDALEGVDGAVLVKQDVTRQSIGASRLRWMRASGIVQRSAPPDRHDDVAVAEHRKVVNGLAGPFDDFSLNRQGRCEAGLAYWPVRASRGGRPADSRWRPGWRYRLSSSLDFRRGHSSQAARFDPGTSKSTRTP